MSELISKDGVVETVCRTRCGDKAKGCPAHSCLVIDEFEALPTVETTAQYDDFHEEIKRLTKEVEYYQDRYEAIVRINDSQFETIRTYKAIMDILDAENKRLRGETK